MLDLNVHTMFTYRKYSKMPMSIINRSIYHIILYTHCYIYIIYILFATPQPYLALFSSENTWAGWD